MSRLKTIFFSMLLLSMSFAAKAQGGSFDNTMRSSGRIYVVVAVMLVILAGLILYLVRLDRKVDKLEKQD